MRFLCSWYPLLTSHWHICFSLMEILYLDLNASVLQVEMFIFRFSAFAFLIKTYTSELYMSLCSRCYHNFNKLNNLQACVVVNRHLALGRWKGRCPVRRRCGSFFWWFFDGFAKKFLFFKNRILGNMGSQKPGRYVTGRPDCLGPSRWEVKNEVWRYLQTIVMGLYVV